MSRNLKATSKQASENATGIAELDDAGMSGSHGLFVLYPTLEFRGDVLAPDVDVVAVHGLNGSVKKTWTDVKTGTFWLEDLLPTSVPNARIMSFAYDSALAFSTSIAGIENFARDLLNRLRLLRADEARDRPLVFIAHSLGGIVVKKALVLAHEAQEFYGSIIQSTRGIVFLGTPHRGSDLVPWSLLLSNVVNIATFGQGVRKKLLRNLQSNSAVLIDISRQFVPRSASFKIMSFVEQQVERPLTSLVVPESSAVLGLPNEMVFPLNAHHRGICRFRGKSDQNYLLVEGAIIEIIGAASTSRPPPHHRILQPSSNSSRRQRLPGLSGLLRRATTRESHSRQRSDAGLREGLSPAASSFGLFSSTASQTTRSPEQATSSYGFGNKAPATTEANRSPNERPSISGSRAAGSGIRLQVTGLRAKLTPGTSDNRDVSRLIEVPSNLPVTGLGQHLIREQPDLKPLAIDYDLKAYGHRVHSTWKDVFTTEVGVTTGRSCYNEHRPLKINHRQSIASFFSRVFPDQIDAAVDTSKRHEARDEASRYSSPSIIIRRGGHRLLSISFKRTIRIPEDGKTYQLPPGLGSFPLFNVHAFRQDLPPPIAALGGLFFPMYQMEAMWIRFRCKGTQKLVVRPFLGGVNGITGEAALGNMAALLRRMNRLTPVQDYVVLPQQRWLDGISTQPGVVKQFVATETAAEDPRRAGPRPGDHNSRNSDESRRLWRRASTLVGASVEWQVTGRDTVGGIQLQIIPQYDVDRMFAGSVKDVCLHDSYNDLSRSQARSFNVLKSPEELGLRDGDTVHIKNLRARLKPREKVMSDLAAESPVPLTSRSVIEVGISQRPVSKCTFKTQVQGVSGPAVAIQFDLDDDFDTMLAVIRAKLGNRHGSLYVDSCAHNVRSALIAVRTWRAVLEAWEFSRELAVPESAKRELPAELPFVWAPPRKDDMLFCKVQMREPYKASSLDTTGARCRLALEKSSTVAALRTEIQKVMGISTAHYSVRPYWGGPELDDSTKILCDAGSDGSNLPVIIDACVDRRENTEIILVGSSRGGTSAQRGRMEVFVKFDHRTLPMTVDGTDSVSSFVKRLSEQIGMSTDHISVIYGAKRLSPGLTLAECGLCKECTLYVVHNARGGGSAGVYIVAPEGSFYAAGNTVGEVKVNILEQLGVAVRLQRLTCRGKVLSDADPVHLYYGKEVHLTVMEKEPVQSLSLGAGGSIEQHIERDDNDPRIWDVASSKLLNIQLIDARTFKLLTGLNPPPTPITPDTYKEMGLPFYHLWREEAKEDGVAGLCWGEIRGAKEVATQNMKRLVKKRHPGKGNKLPPLDEGEVRVPSSNSEPAEDGDEDFNEVGYDFPLVKLWDVDDTILQFKSAVQHDCEEDDGWR